MWPSCSLPFFFIGYVAHVTREDAQGWGGVERAHAHPSVATWLPPIERERERHTHTHTWRASLHSHSSSSPLQASPSHAGVYCSLGTSSREERPCEPPHPRVSVEPEQGEVINGPNLGGFLGLAPDLRRLGRQGLAWLSGTQGLSGPGIWASPKERLCCDPAGNGSLAGLRTSFTTRLSLPLHARGLPSCGSPASSGSPAENFFFFASRG